MSGIAAGAVEIAGVSVGATEVTGVSVGAEEVWTSTPPGYWFNMVAGAKDDDRGYISDFFVGPIGSIDREPIDGVELGQFLMVYDGDLGRIQFVGNCAALLTGLSVFIDGTGGYPLTGVSWDGSTFTSANFDAYPRPMTTGQSYLVELGP